LTHRPRKTLAVLAATLVLGLAACSDSAPETTGAGATSTNPLSPPTSTATAVDLSAEEILAKAKSRAEAATSGAYQGTFEESGTKMEIGYRGTADGSTAETKLKLGRGGQATVVSVDGKTYLTGDDAFWAAAGLPSPGPGKYAEVPAAEAPTAGLELSGMLNDFFANVTADDLATKVEEEKVEGVDAWVLTDKDGKDEGTMHIAKDTFDVLRLFGSEGGEGQFEFSDWNERFDIKAPDAGDVVVLR
jgi:hypothetical protein